MVYSVTMDDLADWMSHRNRVLVMGIVNVTPDSFFDGGLAETPGAAIGRALRMVDEGADLLDVGGESTRPGSRSVGAQEEMDRVLPVIEGIRRRCDVVVSVDTTKARVASEALRAGATIVNDVTALSDPDMAGCLASHGASVVLMHMKGTPATMQRHPVYDDVVSEVMSFLSKRVEVAVISGIPRERILVDPGIGFGKRLDHNLALLADLGRLRTLGRPILVGVSRKSMFGDLLGLPVADRLEATIAANAVAVVHGADMIRVHDVKEGRRAADVACRLRPHET